MPIKSFLLAALCCVATAASATPAIQHWQSASGAKVLFVENHDIPMLDVSVSLPAGSSFDSADKSGVAGLTHHLLDLGAEGLSEDDIARGMADIGAQFGGGFDPDRASVSLRTLSSSAERDKALDIMARVLQHPLFPEEILAREKARLIASLKEDETKPESIADKAFQKALYGTHPYGFPVSGEVASVEKITAQDLRAFHAAHYRASTAVVAIMGDVSRTQAEAIAEKLTEKLPAGTAPAALPNVTMRISASEQRIAHPASQSHILIGVPGMSRNDPDYFPLYVGNHILGGGGFVSRLMNEGREKRGLAYYVRADHESYLDTGTLAASAGVDLRRIEDAIKVILLEFKKITKEKVLDKELKKAKEYLKGRIILAWEDSRTAALSFGSDEILEGKVRTLDEYLKRIDEVRAEDILRVAQFLFTNNKLNLAVIGPFRDAVKFEKILQL